MTFFFANLEENNNKGRVFVCENKVAYTFDYPKHFWNKISSTNKQKKKEKRNRGKRSAQDLKF